MALPTRSMTIEEQFFKKPLSVQSPTETGSIVNLEAGGKMPIADNLFTKPTFWDKVENKWVYIVAGTVIIIGIVALFYRIKQPTKNSLEIEDGTLKKEESDNATITKDQQERNIKDTSSNSECDNSPTLNESIESMNNRVFKPTTFY